MKKLSKETKAKFKGKETWVSVYEGHEIKIVNKFRVSLYIDGNEVARQKGMSRKSITLTADIPDTEKMVSVTLSSDGGADGVEIKCLMIIGDKAETVHGFTMKDSSFAPMTPEEEELYIQMKKEMNEAASVAAILASM